MASINLGGVISQQIGVWLTHFLGILYSRVGITNDKFDNLWILILATNFASQLPMPFIGAVSEEDVARCKRSSFIFEESMTLPVSAPEDRSDKYY
jgi:hypothetical protein